MNRAAVTTAGLLPNAIIAGAPKSGTSSVHRWIASHPDALGSTEKETYYFVDPGTHMYRPDAHISNGLDGYRRYFPAPAGAKPRVVIESTPGYLYSRVALRELPRLPTNPKFAFLLREPAAQVYSAFTYFKNNWNWIPASTDFADYIRQVDEGRARFRGNEQAENGIAYAKYVDFLLQWRNEVGPERMRVWTFDQLCKDSLGLTKDVAQFFGLSPDFYDTFDFDSSNETYEVRSNALQELNLLVRKRLPGGSFYDALRSAYRSLNTRRPAGPTEADRAAMARLRPRFVAANARLAEEFGLDLSGWE